MTVQDTYAVAGIIIGVARLIYAIMTNRDKARTERLIKEELRGFAGNVHKIRNSASWADSHLRSIHEFALNLDRDENVKKEHKGQVFILHTTHFSL